MKLPCCTPDMTDGLHFAFAFNVDRSLDKIIKRVILQESVYIFWIIAYFDNFSGESL